MVSRETRTEVEQYLGRVPSFIEAMAEPAADHSWALMRDLQLEETDLTGREKALVGLGAASSIQCPYCVHFHTEEAKLEGITDDELKEAVNVAGSVRYFSTGLHGAQVDVDDFKAETAEIVAHIQEMEAAADD